MVNYNVSKEKSNSTDMMYALPVLVISTTCDKQGLHISNLLSRKVVSQTRYTMMLMPLDECVARMNELGKNEPEDLYFFQHNLNNLFTFEDDYNDDDVDDNSSSIFSSSTNTGVSDDDLSSFSIKISVETFDEEKEESTKEELSKESQEEELSKALLSKEEDKYYKINAKQQQN